MFWLQQINVEDAMFFSISNKKRVEVVVEVVGVVVVGWRWWWWRCGWL